MTLWAASPYRHSMRYTMVVQMKTTAA